MEPYLEFIRKKCMKSDLTPYVTNVDCVCDDDVHELLYDWQKKIVCLGFNRQRFAFFEDCGMGKTLQQLEFARLVSRGDKRVLIVTPLTVAKQTVQEARKINMEITYSRNGKCKTNVTVTNYENLHKFSPEDFYGMVLDESSLIKNHTRKAFGTLCTFVKCIPYRLCCTATPAPNDYTEFGTHAEFLGVCSRHSMLSRFFVRDRGDSNRWRLKHHAHEPFWKWVSSWAIAIRKPSDMGESFSDDKFTLPPLQEHRIYVGDKESAKVTTFSDRNKDSKLSLSARVRAVKNLVDSAPNECTIVWCFLNRDADALKLALVDSVEVRGSHSIKKKQQALTQFSNGKSKILITKPKIAGFGVNWQHCARIIFCGMTYSYEQYYQAIRRCWRYGQVRPVQCYIICTYADSNVFDLLERKHNQTISLYKKTVTPIMQHCFAPKLVKYSDPTVTVFKSKLWAMYHGDAVMQLQKTPKDSIHLSVFSPPFANLYIYSSSALDMSNCANMTEFLVQFQYLAKELMRVTKPGRLVCVHCMDIPAIKERHGYIGLLNFPGKMIELFQTCGFIFHSRHMIWKDPLVEVIRTKASGLLFRQVQKDCTMCRAGIGDQILTFRKPGTNIEPVQKTTGFKRYIGKPEMEPERALGPIKYSQAVWRRYASPMWDDIRQSRTLNVKHARTKKDEKHLTALQLDVIERLIEIYSNEGDVVLSPFAGIGSEGYVALQMKRQFIGIELKQSYWKQAIKNLQSVPTL